MLLDQLTLGCSHVSTREKPDNGLVDEALLTAIKEVPEVASEVLKEKSYKFSLVFRLQLLEKVEVLDEHVVIVGDCIVDQF